MKSWLYAKSRGIKPDEQLHLEVYGRVRGRDTLILEAKNVRADDSGAIKVELNWGLVQQKLPMQMIFAYIFDKENSNMIAATTTLVKSSTLLKLADYKSAVMVGSASVGDGSGNTGSCACKDYDLIWGEKVSCDFRKKVVNISKDLWPDKYKTMANGLMAVMKVETSETFSPSKIELVSYIDENGKKRKKYQGLSKEAVNKLDNDFSGAVGLIQFTKEAIDALNTENSLNLNKKKLALMSEVEQLDYVKKYFMLYNWHKKLLSPEDIYLQVFAPSGIAKNDNYLLYEKYEDPKTEKQKTSTKNYNANQSVIKIIIMTTKYNVPKY